ncbi:MAG: helix-turn-helix domain-containing protein [bacterium]|nr:helix-turn-helix domain-containing protein [bacterium]
MPPAATTETTIEKRLSVTEFEEISRCLALNGSFRAIARRIGRALTTIAPEVNNNGGRSGYQAVGSSRIGNAV